MGTKKTHEVNQAFIESWLSKNEGKTGVWLFDIQRQSIRFDSGKSPQFSFAAENYLYIPEVDGKRNENAEKWFSSLEGALKTFTEHVAQKDFRKTFPSKDLTGAIMALISFGYRSGYEIKLLKRYLLESDQLRTHYNVKNDDDAHVAVVESMVNVITMQAKKYFQTSSSVIYDLPIPLLLCDRPLVDQKIESIDTAFSPISPNAAIMLNMGSQNSIPEIIFQKGSKQNSGLCDNLNSFTIQRARKWVIATSKAQLEAVKSELTLEKFESRKNGDKIEFIPPEKHGQTTWWSLP